MRRINPRTGADEAAGQAAVCRAARPHQPGGGGVYGTEDGKQTPEAHYTIGDVKGFFCVARAGGR